MKNLSGIGSRPSPEGIRRRDAPWKKLLASIVLASLFSAPAWSASQTVTLSVPGMTCAACPLTVKKALTRVEGVSKVEVSFEDRQVLVTFDDSKTSAQALTRASENAGYPASFEE
ncbi:MAG: mercury resistance system periplasmic binding protein MerP [Pseudomonas sp.]|uniref:mercury resistance system periplasmic binding protein MerP n=1 Tax=Pseudomonas sp. TaxID=306 RepID=UPI003BB7CECE